MHLVAWLPVGIDDRAAARAAADADVETVPLSTFRVGAPGRPGLALGFASSSVPGIQAATERLARALELLSRRPKTSRR
jgi:GntR family transcriptional regulator/MocR family aminotransferase